MYKQRMIVMAVVTGVVGLGFVAGCRDISGKWSLAEVEPAVVRPAFDYEVLTLQDDGTFYGEIRGGTTVTGTYVYDDGQLVLTGRDGLTQVYRARFHELGRELELRNWNKPGIEAKLVKSEEIHPLD